MIFVLSEVSEDPDLIRFISTCHVINGYNIPRPEDWAILAKVSALEIQQDVKTGDLKHLPKEMADLAFVAIHGLYVLGYDPKKVLRARLHENMKKDLNGRNIEYYVQKIQELEVLLHD